MNEEFAIHLKTVLDESSISNVKSKLESAQSELQDAFNNITVKVNAQNVGSTKVTSPGLGSKLKEANAELQVMQKRYAELMAMMEEFQKNANLTFKPTQQQWDQFDKWNEEAIELQDKIAELQTKIDQMKNSTGEMADATAQIVNDFDIHIKQVKNIDFNWKSLVSSAKSMFLGLIGIQSVYSLIRKSISTYLSQNQELQNQMNQLYYTLGSAIEPVLKWIVRLFATIVLYVDYILRAFGFAGLKMNGFASGAGKASKSMSKTAKDAEKINKQLAGFDEINNLSKNDDVDLGDSGGGGIGSSVWDDSFVGKIKEKIAEISAIISGALLVIGAILVFTGANVPLGLGLMAIGALGLAAVIKENWGHMSESIARVLSSVLGVVAGATLVLGFFLTFVVGGTALPLGIGLLVVGAASLAAAVAVNWNSTSNHIANAVRTIMGIISGAMIVIGAILVLSGSNLPLGIALLVGGLGTFAAANVKWGDFGTKVKKEWDNIKENTKKAWANISKIVGDKWGETKEKVVDFAQNMSEKLSSGWETLKNTASTKWGNIKDTLISKWNEAKTSAPGVWESVSTTIKTKIKNAFSNAGTDSKNGYNQMKASFGNAGTDFGTIANTIKAKLSGAFSGIKTAAQNAWNDTSNVFNSNSSTSQTIATKIRNFFAGIKAVLSPEVKLPKITGSSTNGNLFWTENGHQVFVAYDRGTNYVPNDQLALLHKGEAVIPREYNQQGTPYVSNDETNELLRQFMNIVQSKDFRAVISQREVGQASVDYIHSQSRIMGGSII